MDVPYDRHEQFSAEVSDPAYTFNTLFEKSADAHVLIHEGVVLDCNEAAARMLGYAHKEQLIGLHLEQFVPPFQSDGRLSRAFIDDVQAAVHQRGSYRFECLGRRANGIVFPLEVLLTVLPLDGQHVVHAVWRDITERVLAVAGLRRSEERFRTFVETVSEAIWCCELETPISTEADAARQIRQIREVAFIVECNEAYACDLVGRTVAEVRGKAVRELPPSACLTGAFFHEFVEAGYRLRNRHHRVIDHRGEERYVVQNSVGIVEDGCLVRIWGSAVDVTENVLLKQQIVTTLELQLQHIGCNLHDGLGQLLTGIHITSERLADKLGNEASPLAEEAERIARYAQGALRQAQALYRGLMPVQLEREGLIPALQALAEQTSELSGVATHFRRGANVPDAWPDRVALHLYRIAQEAVTNAVRHGAPGHITIALSAADGGVVLRVEDDGRGFQAGGTARGDGLGLHSLQYRAASVGASLDVQSAPGKGTIMVCTLPLDRMAPVKNNGMSDEW